MHAAHVILRRLRSAYLATLHQTDHFQANSAHAISSISMQDSHLASRVLQTALHARPPILARNATLDTAITMGIVWQYVHHKLMRYPLTFSAVIILTSHSHKKGMRRTG